MPKGVEHDATYYGFAQLFSVESLMPKGVEHNTTQWLTVLGVVVSNL